MRAYHHETYRRLGRHVAAYLAVHGYNFLFCARSRLILGRRAKTTGSTVA